METIRQAMQRPTLRLIAAGLLGLALGILYAWVLNPVEWTDATPAHLRQADRIDFLRSAIDSYAVNRDVDLAVARYQALGEAAPSVLAAIQAEPGEVSPAAVESFVATISLYQPVASATPRSGTASPAAPSVTQFLLPVCGVTLLLGLLLGGALILRGRTGRRAGPRRENFDEPMAEEAHEQRLAPGALPAGLERPPLATFRTTYTLGDDLYDDSFSVESANGDFLGECGVGIGDLIGVGEPKKVSAFEVWLFDKNDIQTVTKVLMSRYAVNDDGTRNRMSAKGDPILAEPGAMVRLETASLMVEARIVDLTYGGGALPAESFFERMTVELRASSKLGVD
jgi:hypothetical protein